MPRIGTAKLIYQRTCSPKQQKWQNWDIDLYRPLWFEEEYACVAVWRPCRNRRIIFWPPARGIQRHRIPKKDDLTGEIAQLVELREMMQWIQYMDTMIKIFYLVVDYQTYGLTNNNGTPSATEAVEWYDCKRKIDRL